MNELNNETAITVMVRAILATAELNYRKDNMEFDDKVVSALIKAVAPIEWQETFCELKEAAKDGE